MLNALRSKTTITLPWSWAVLSLATALNSPNDSDDWKNSFKVLGTNKKYTQINITCGPGYKYKL